MELIATTYVYTTPYKDRFPFMIRWEPVHPVYDELRRHQLDLVFDQIVSACHPAEFGDDIVERVQYHHRLLIHFEDNRDFMLAKLRFG